MLTLLFFLSLAIVLKQVGVNMPFVDKVSNLANSKLDKFRNRSELAVNVESNAPLNKDNEPFCNIKRRPNFGLYSNPYQVSNYYKIYSSTLKI